MCVKVAIQQLETFRMQLRLMADQEVGVVWHTSASQISICGTFVGLRRLTGRRSESERQLLSVVCDKQPFTTAITYGNLSLLLRSAPFR